MGAKAGELEVRWWCGKDLRPGIQAQYAQLRVATGGKKTVLANKRKLLADVDKAELERGQGGAGLGT